VLSETIVYLFTTITAINYQKQLTVIETAYLFILFNIKFLFILK